MGVPTAGPQGDNSRRFTSLQQTISPGEEHMTSALPTPAIPHEKFEMHQTLPLLPPPQQAGIGSGVVIVSHSAADGRMAVGADVTNLQV